VLATAVNASVTKLDEGVFSSSLRLELASSLSTSWEGVEKSDPCLSLSEHGTVVVLVHGVVVHVVLKVLSGDV